MIDSGDGDFFGAASIGAGGVLGLFFLVVAIVLWLVAAGNENECEKRACETGMTAKLLDGECLCVRPAEPKP